MPTKEQIAHELTMLYLSNRYGTDVLGTFTVMSGMGDGTVNTRHLPKPEGRSRKENEHADQVFHDIVKEYRCAYAKFLSVLNEEE